MGGTWQGRRISTDGPGPRIAVATYRATVGLEVEQSSFSLSPSLDREIVATAVLKKPEWCSRPWPAPVEPAERVLRQLALLKMCFNFDFASELEGQTGDEVRESLWKRFPDLRAMRSDQNEEHGFKRFYVSANVDVNDSAEGGFTYTNEGELPPLGTDADVDELDIMIKNLIRADIRDHLEREGFHW